jgi:hypothetical protein
MSKIYVAEFVSLGTTDQSDSVNIMPVPASVEYTVIVSAGSSGAAQPFLPTTKFIEISTDTTASIAIGLFPGVVGTGSALLTNCRLSPGERIIRRVPFSQPTVQGAPAYAIFTTANV